jgi:hypothetical protein
MRKWLLFLAVLLGLARPDGSRAASPAPDAPAKKVYVLPIRDDIMPPLTYLVRRWTWRRTAGAWT